MTTCSECGRTGDTSCDALFDRLLALDHSRAEPWGPLHGVAVACYRLQHPTQVPEGPQLLVELLRVFIAEGSASARRLTEHWRRANSHRNRGRAKPAHQPAAVVPEAFRFTIGDVAVDGTFPAPGYEQRLRTWAGATLAAWDRVG